jgi:hypothetical protein
MARLRHANHEFVEARFVPRYKRKGWLERDFNIGGTWFLWRRNIAIKAGVFRFGVRGEPRKMELS